MKKLLVVDDENSIINLIGIWAGDYQVIKAHCFESAIEHFEQAEPDLVLTDVKLIGNFSGIDLVKKLKLLNEDVPLLVMTGHGTKEIAVECIKNGAFDFLEKPFDKVSLILSLNKAYQMRRDKVLLKNLRDELKQQNSNLIHEIEEKSQFLRIISHDISNPLQKISFYLNTDVEERNEKINEIISIQNLIIKKIRKQERDKVSERKTTTLVEIKKFIESYF